MHIALVLMKYNPFGGYERQAALLAEELSAGGHDVTVFANAWKGGQKAGVRFEKVPMLRLASWLKVLSFALFSKSRLKRRPFDVVISFDRTLAGDIYRAGNACHREWQAFRRRHGSALDAVSMAINPLHTVINAVEKRIFSRIQASNGTIVVLSPLGMEQIRSHYEVDTGRFIVIPPAVDLDRFDVTLRPELRARERERLGLDEDTKVLLHVGSGFRIKGLRRTIEAMARLDGDARNYVLLIAGSDRKETGRLKTLASSLGVEPRVRFLGGVKDIENLYAAADVFVLPSLFETFGVAVVEALSSGLPVIIGRGAGAASFVEDARAGRVIDVPAEPGRLAAMIRETIEAEDEFDKAGRLAEEQRRRAEAAAGCSRASVMEKYLWLIENTVSRKAR